MDELVRKFEEETNYVAWVNDVDYLNGRVYTTEYVKWLEKKVIDANKTNFTISGDKIVGIINRSK